MKDNPNNGQDYWHTLPSWKKFMLMFIVCFCTSLSLKENPWSITSGWKQCDVRTIYDKKTGLVEPGLCYRLPTPNIMPLAARMVDAASKHVQKLTEEQKQKSPACGVFVHIRINQPNPSGQTAVVFQKNPFFGTSLCDEIGDVMLAEARKMDEEIALEWKEAGEKMMREKGWSSATAP